QTYTAVSELAKGAKKSQTQSSVFRPLSSEQQAGTFLPKFAKITLAISMILGFSSSAMAVVSDAEFKALKRQVEALKTQKTFFHVNSATNTGSGDPITNSGYIFTSAGARRLGAIAAGESAVSGGNNAISIGRYSNAKGLQSIAIGGSGAPLSASSGLLSQIQTIASGSQSIALGGDVHAEGNGSIAIGGDDLFSISNTNFDGTDASLGLAPTEWKGNVGELGKYYKSLTGKNMDIFTRGKEKKEIENRWTTKSSGEGSVAIGLMAVSEGALSTALGVKSKAIGLSSIALGLAAQAQGRESIALGAAALANNKNSVALGSKAETRAFTQEDSATVNGLKYKDFTGFADGVVSVGKDYHEKQIINVAPGKIAQTSTDAINGSQLFATNKAIGNVAKSVKNNFGGNAALNENGNITFTNIGGTGKGTIHEAIGDIKTTADAAKRKTLANSTTLNNKADKNAGNLSTADVAAWKRKIDTDTNSVERVTKGDGIEVTGGTTAKNKNWTVALSQDTKTKLAKIAQNETALGNKADKNAGNLGATEVNAWTTKLNTGANIAAPKGKLVTDSQVKTALDTKLDADDITSKDKSVTIDTKTTAGKVDLKINVDGSTIKVNDEGQLQAVASAPEVDGTSVALNSAGKVSVKDKGISAAKLADNAVTEDKIADALLTELKAKSREKVKAGAGIKVSPTTVAADKDNQEFTVSLSDAVKTKLDNLAANPNATYLNKTGSNIGNDTAKATFGQNVGKASITGNGTQLVQEKAVKSYVDGKAVQLGNQITNVSKTLKEEVAIVENSGLTLDTTAATTTKGAIYTLGLDAAKVKEVAGTTTLPADLAAKANKDASNLTDPADVGKWKKKLGIDGLPTNANIASKLEADDITSKDKSVTIDTKTTAGKVDLKINVDGSTIKVNDEGQLQAVASAPEVDGTSVALNSAGKVSVKDKGISAAKLADNAVTEDKIADALLTELKAKSREKVKAGAGIKVSPTTVAADKDNQEFTVSLSDAVKTKLDNLATNPNATYLNKTGSNIGNDTAKATFGQNVGKASITGNGTQLVQEKAVKSYVDNKAVQLGNQITNVSKTLKEEVAIVENSGLTLDTTAATTTKGAIYTLGLDAAKVKEVAGTTTLPADLAAKANKDASNLTDPADVGKWKEKLGIDGLATNSNIASKLEANDIISTDKTIGIDTKTTAGKVDLKVNLDGTTLAKNSKGAIGLIDNAVTTAKILNAAVTKEKLGTDVTTVLNKVGVGKVETGNQNTVTGGAVKTYVDGKATELTTQITNVGKTSKEEVAIVENSGLTLTKTNATTEKGAKYTLGLDAEKVKEVAGTTNLATDYLKVDGSNIANNKATLGQNVGKDTIDGKTTELVQEKAVKTYVDTALEKVGKAKDGKDGYIGVDGKDGKNGVGIDGKDGITVKGKDGKNGVTIKGEDGVNGTNGVIGLNGHDGIDGKPAKDVSADIKVVNGKAGVNGKDGESLTRVIYQDETGTTHTVATLDDGLVFAGNTPNKVMKALNDTLVIEGQKGTDPAKHLTKDAEFAADNIFVDTTDGKLEIKLAKKLQGVEGIGIAGKDGLSIAGKDGANGLNGKDGENAVAINGKDGISIKGKDGKDGVSIKGEDGISIKGEDGMDGLNGIGLNGKDGITVNGKDGKDGKDSIAINGKDGISIKGENGKDGISIKGEDGIAVNGKNGKDGVSIHGDDGISIKGEDGKTLVTLGKDGQNGVIGLQGAPGKNGADGKFYDISIQNGKDGLDGTTTDRIVYVDKATGDKKEVATLDDGLVFAGNTPNKVMKALNDTLVIEGQKGTDPAKHLTKDAEFAADNIFVDTTDGKLEIKLAKKLQGVEGIGIAGKDGLSIAGKDGANGLNGKDGENAVAINGKDGISIKGKDGKDGISIKGADGIAVNGKDGKNGVTIKGEDGVNGTNGVIGLNGHDGIDGKPAKDVSADIKVVNGKAGVNGKDGESLTRVIYQDETGTTHTVATLDDGFILATDNGKQAVKLNDTLNIKGGVTETAKLSDNNIGVVNNGTDGLAVKLAKDLTGLDSIVFGAAKGNDVVSISNEGINAGGKRITNIG
ncbi:hypothetical protein QJU17_09930, partial [Pasteurella atlantica]